MTSFRSAAFARAPRSARTVAFLALLLLASLIPPLAAPPSVAAASCTGWKSALQPPPTIRVLRTRGPHAGRVQTVNFRTYVEVVMPAEWGPQHPREALRAGAVAIKQYAWYHTMHWRGRSASGGCYDVVDSTNDQVYSPETKRPAPAHISAVDATWDWSMRRGGRFFASGYRAGSAVACGADAGRGVMMQKSASRCARDGRSAQEILAIYYGRSIAILDGDGEPVGDAKATGSAAKPPAKPAAAKVAAPSGLIGDGDSTGDAKGDVIAVAPAQPEGSLETRLYPSGSVPGGGGPVRIALAHPPVDTIGRAAGDASGDGLDDLAILLRTPEGGLRLDLARGVKGGALAPATAWWEGTAAELGWTDGATLLFALGDVNGDGEADALALVGSTDPLVPTTVHWFRSSGTAFADPVMWWTGPVAIEGAAFHAADIDADRRDDLILQTDRAQEEPGSKGIRFSIVRAATVTKDGPTTPAVPWLDVTDITPAQAHVAVSDINRDRRLDVVIQRPIGSAGSRIVGLLSSGNGFTPRTLWQNPNSFRWSASQIAGADVNGDGRGDVVVVYNLGSRGSRFFRFTSNGSSLSVAGSTTDATLPWAETAIY